MDKFVAAFNQLQDYIEGNCAMNPKTIDRNLSVSEQIASQDIAAIASAGFKSVICNRPDGEGADQPVFAEIETAARAAGLTAAYLPIRRGFRRRCDRVRGTH